MRLGSYVAGVALPRLLHVPLSNPLAIAHWISDAIRNGRTPHVFTFVSSAVRLCKSAADAGIDLTGAEFTVGGEPITDVRLEAVRSAGANAAPRYGSMECGPIGYGCLAPTAPDDVHLQHDLHAVIQPGAAQTALPADAILITSLHPASPFTLFNVSMGDHATVETRACGCPFDHLGFATHLWGIRSFEKLTAGGMTFFDTDVIRVLEEVLPSRFGGMPTDYQLVEEESADGQPRITLLVNPSIGALDSTAVGEAFLSAIGSGSIVDRMMEIFWHDSGFLRVERAVPMSTNSGKILHLHSRRAIPER